MRGAAFDSPLRVFSREKTINKTRRKGVASANTVENLKILAIPGLIEIACVVADRAPIVSCCRCSPAKRGGHNLERKILHPLADHLLKGFGIQGRKVLISSRDFVAERRREIFFVAKHHI